MKIRVAQTTELDWINRNYDAVEFVPSVFAREIIAIAEIDGQKAGLGRLVTVDACHLELGGIYVFEPFRRKGVARAIVQFLLSYTAKITYCIPFEPLTPFYQEFGFLPCEELDLVPQEILAKYRWCQKKYSQPTALLILKRNG